MTSLKGAVLTLFFTRRVGLHSWYQTGSLEREVEVYRRLATRLGQVHFVTYGGRQDKALAKLVAPIDVCATPARMPVRISQAFLAARCGPVLRQSDVLKTNQIPGAEIAVWAKGRYGKKLIVRCGYLYSQFMERHTASQWRIRRAYALEREAFAAADAGVVTSERDRRLVIDKHGIDPAKMHVIPNYVVTDLFKPAPEIAKTHDLVCVAKASPQKNLGALLEAMRVLRDEGLPASLMLIGSAARDTRLREHAHSLGLRVTYYERIPNFSLPEYLNRARAYVLPSLYEGHPKTLLEAMSCGLPCIGTEVVGTRDDIRHLESGYLCQPDAESLADAIHEVLQDAQLRRELGDRARRHVVERYSVESTTEQELAVIRDVVGERAVPGAPEGTAAAAFVARRAE